MNYIIPCTIVAFIVTYFVIPPILYIAFKRKLYKIPEERSSHFVPTPSLGGIGIFTGFMLSILFFAPFMIAQDIRYLYLLGAFIIIFIIGVQDDLDPLPARVKLLAQSIATTLLIAFADIRLHSLHGFFSWSGEMPYWLSFIVSMITILAIMNAFNLIDGINGLSASLGVLAVLLLGCWFYFTGNLVYAIIAASTGGAYLAFLCYNLIPPVRIFMGDTGSLLLGTIVAVLTIRFIELNSDLLASNPFKLSVAPVIAISIIIVPLFDILRVFITRMYNGKSPMVADRRHVHHLLIDYGFSHIQATAILVLFSTLIIITAFIGQYFIEQHILLMFTITLAVIPVYFLDKAVAQKVQKPQYIEELPPRLHQYEPTLVKEPEHELEMF